MTRLALFALLSFAPLASAQAPQLRVDPGVQLPKERATGAGLVSSLDQFLKALAEGADGDEWIYEPEFVETAILVNELRPPSNEPRRMPEIAYSPHLCNVARLPGKTHFVQVCYVGLKQGEPVVGRTVELIAHESERGYSFSSTLARNTRHWETLQLGTMAFHYRGAMDLAKAREYHALAASFDKKIGYAPKKVEFYFFDDDLEARHAIGLPHDVKFNGDGGSTRWSAVLEDQEIYLLGKAQFDSFDPHDLWHNRLTKVKPRDAVNRAVDEGIATLYGGSWGLSWRELFAAFQEQIDVSEDTDWLDLREKKIAFTTRGRRNPTDFMVNALIVKKLESDGGFDGVWRLLNTKGEEAYFDALEDLTGISRQNYNQKVWELLRKEIAELNG